MGLFRRWAINAIFILTGLVYFLGLFIEILDVDSAQYALLSREMLESGDFLQVHLQGRDYLDKPPFLFWLNSFFFNIFGYTTWSFRIGSVLFSAAGVIATYKLGNLLYNKRIGFVAALMLMSSQAFIIMNNDVRTDTILTSAVIIAVWKLTAFLYYKRKRDLIFGFVGIAVAMMTKGPIGLMVPMLALVSYTIGRSRYRDLFRKEWLIGFGIVAILLIPMSLGLYEQYDLHPEKSLSFNSDNGVTVKDSVSGLKFYFWDQSFGRLTGENVWSNGLGPDFFVHTFLWAFFPWALLAIWAFFWRVAVAIKDVLKGEKKQEWLTLGGFILPFVALSFSQYKLPHYINVVLPFAAIFTSEFTLRIAYEKSVKWFRAAQAIQGFILLLAIAVYYLIVFVFFPDSSVLWILFGIAGFGVGFYFFFKGMVLDKLVTSTLFIALTVNVLLNGLVYPEIMEYQASDDVSRDLELLDVKEENFYVYRSPASFSLAYLTGFQLNQLSHHLLSNHHFNPNSYFYGTDEGLELLKENGVSYEVVREYPTFHVTLLKWEFLNAETRKDATTPSYLVRILTP